MSAISRKNLTMQCIECGRLTGTRLYLRNRDEEVAICELCLEVDHPAVEVEEPSCAHCGYGNPEICDDCFSVAQENSA